MSRVCVIKLEPSHTGLLIGLNYPAKAMINSHLTASSSRTTTTTNIARPLPSPATDRLSHTMGFFTSSPSPTTPEKSTDGGFIAPDRSARDKCWSGRDAFFKCLDENDIIDSVKEDEKARKLCAPELKAFEAACADSWVTYFKKRKVFEHQKALTLKRLEEEGAQPMDGGKGAALRGR